MYIEVFADIWCPFTHVGLRAIDEQRRLRGRTDVGVRVRAWPLELINGGPMDPVKTAHNADLLREQVAPEMFGHVDPEHFPTSTLEALALEARGYRTAQAVGEQASFLLRDALFERGQDISDPTTIAALADELGVGTADDDDRATVLADWEDGRRRGVRGSPHFFCGDADVFCPTLEISRTPEAGLTIKRDAARLSEFVQRCLAQQA